MQVDIVISLIKIAMTGDIFFEFIGSLAIYSYFSGLLFFFKAHMVSMYNWQTSSSPPNSLHAHPWQIKHFVVFFVCCSGFTANILWSSRVPSTSCVSPRKSCEGLWHFLRVMLNLAQSASNLQQELLYCRCQDRPGLWHSRQEWDHAAAGPCHGLGSIGKVVGSGLKEVGAFSSLPLLRTYETTSGVACQV